MLEKRFDLKKREAEIYQKWEASGAFKPDERESWDDSYSIVIPPPNVTGNLHIGHALNYTLQDILIRYARMRGKNTVWIPGFDHAGIATQMVVEQNLAKQGLDKKTLGRQAFLEKVWEWKEESQSIMETQLKKLGVSCDWSRSHFTLDQNLSKAVNKVFVDLSRKQLVYRDFRLVNWDPYFQSAISDLEVENKTVKGKLWSIAYQIVGRDEQIIISTTRPETMLGDVAIAVHPEDPRYQHLKGAEVWVPIINRKVLVIMDEYVDPEYGTGALKVTPAHDFNDFEIGKRHQLKPINIFDQRAHLNKNVPENYQGLDRYTARERIVKELEEAGQLKQVEEIEHSLPYADRSSVVIEPYLTYQWFVDAKTLAQPAIKAVRSQEIEFIPKHWEKTYFEWMNHIQPWCISRQLWWGHQIPAWYGPDGKCFIAESEEDALNSAEQYYKKKVALKRDEDVLDTWFSSALWPFATLGWPEKTKDLNRFLPGSILVTAFDIIFFWVARMIMQTLEFTNKIPFKQVFIHALVRDEKGQKMSKSKGNVVDPLTLIDHYGTDAVRFTLAALTTQGQDLRLSESRIVGYRNFTTKLWNAARFCQLHECVAEQEIKPQNLRLDLNLWIFYKLQESLQKIDQAFQQMRFNEATNEIYHFIWGIYCDWYLELVKPVLLGENQDLKTEAKNTAAYILDHCLKLLHPFMPYITEEIWEKILIAPHKRASMLISESWPKQQDLTVFEPEKINQIDQMIELIGEIRSVRTEMRIPAGLKIPLFQPSSDQMGFALVSKHWEMICKTARLSEHQTGSELPEYSAQIIVNHHLFALPLKGIIDLETEKKRLNEEVKKCDQEIQKLDQKLENKHFLQKAPKAIIEENQERKEHYKTQKQKLIRAQNWIHG